MEISKVKIGKHIYDIKDEDAAKKSGSLNRTSTKLYITGAESQSSSCVTYSNKNCYIDESGDLYVNNNKVVTYNEMDGTDTKNTTGSTNKVATKLFLTGAENQSANPITYSNVNCYIGEDNNIYSGGSKVITVNNISQYSTGGTDTKNTTGSTEQSNTTMYLIGAQTQGENPVTYSNSNCYIGEDNCIYSNGVKVATTSDIEHLGQSDSDTKNTTGSNQKSSTLLYLIGAESLSDNPVTYSNNNCYIGADGYLYSNGSKVITVNDGSIGGSGTDTKNTTGATNKTNTKLFITASQTQGENPITYSNESCYIGEDNCLYSNNSKAVTASNILQVIQNIDSNDIVKYQLVGYDITRINGSGNLNIPGIDPIYIVNVTDNISSVTLQNNPIFGHSCRVIFKSADNSEHIVTISNSIPNRICPNASKGIVLTVPATNNGYVEVDFLNVGNSTVGDEIYVRGL